MSDVADKTIAYHLVVVATRSGIGKTVVLGVNYVVYSGYGVGLVLIDSLSANGYRLDFSAADNQSYALVYRSTARLGNTIKKM